MDNNRHKIYPVEKVISVLSYWTFGMVGLVYWIIAIVMKQKLKTFVGYHILLSIFLSLLLYIISNILVLLSNLLGIIPFLKPLIFSLLVIFKSELISVFGLHFSLVTLITMGLYTYLSVGAILGKYSYLPWVSEVINYNLGRWR